MLAKEPDEANEGSDVTEDMQVSECSEDDGSRPEPGYYASGYSPPRPSAAPPLKIKATTAAQRRDVRRFVWATVGGQLSDQAESEMASEFWFPWQLRGPPGPKDGGPTTWRNQKWRETSKFGPTMAAQSETNGLTTSAS